MLRKFPPQTAFMPHPMMPIDTMDKNAKRDFFGEQLFTKISTNKQFGHISDFYSKIVGIFLDLDDNIIERLIHDELYFTQQVSETVRVNILFIFSYWKKRLSDSNKYLVNLKKIKII